MDNENAITPGMHTYKYKAWVLLLNLFSLLFFVGVLGVPLAAFIIMGTSFFRPGTEGGPLPFLYLGVFAPLIMLIGALILLQIAAVGTMFFSYIRTTPEGIEHKIWPYRHIRSPWAEVDRLDRILYYDALFLKSYQVIGPSLSFAWPWKYFQFTRVFIPLSMYNGWPGGPLADDLQRYAPALLERRSAAQVDFNAAPPSSGTPLSQDQRLLAALSHASVMFTGAGVFVPLVIYITQKQKSAFLAVQALQAFIYQLAGGVLGMLFPLCVFGVILVPAIAASVLEEPVLAPTMAVILLLFTFAFPIMLVLFILAFTLYGVVGAIQSYQGKDFRYLIIGKQVSRDSRSYGP